MEERRRGDGILAHPRQVLLGGFVLLLGTAVYLIGRPAWQLTFLPDSLHVQWLPAGIPGPVGGSLPSFLHVSGCILLSAGVIATNRKACAAICASWALAAAAFEVLQADLFSSVGPGISLGAGSSRPVLGWIGDYAASASFDPNDLLAILLGAISAYWLLTRTYQREAQHDHVQT